MSDPAHLSALEAARLIAAGALTSETLVRACLDRIAEREPVVGAWEHLDPDRALAEARQRDRQPSRGPLHGVPIAVKDIMNTADQPTTSGSRAYEGHRPAGDAACVALARAAGAVVLGKTVTTEFAAMSPGKTRNPHDPARTPGGSSSGSAAAVADFMAPLAFGTQTAGSIIRPASFCGIVGFKPSYGTVAIAGTKTLAPGLDTVGGFARCVADVAGLVAALTDRPALREGERPSRPRIGICEPAAGLAPAPESAAALERATRRLGEAGAAIRRYPAYPDYAALTTAQHRIMLYEAAHNLAWERLERSEALAAGTRDMLAEGAAIGGAAYEQALHQAAAARAGAADFFGDLDAVLVPSAPGEAPHGMPTGDAVFNRIWTLLHLPCITLPWATGPNGLPVGVQLVGRPRDDARLLAVAGFAEAAFAAGSPS